MPLPRRWEKVPPHHLARNMYTSFAKRCIRSVKSSQHIPAHRARHGRGSQRAARLPRCAPPTQAGKPRNRSKTACSSRRGSDPPRAGRVAKRPPDNRAATTAHPCLANTLDKHCSGGRRRSCACQETASLNCVNDQPPLPQGPACGAGLAQVSR